MIVRFRVDRSLRSDDIRLSDGVTPRRIGQIQFGNRSSRVISKQTSPGKTAGTALNSKGKQESVVWISQALRDKLRLPENTPLRIQNQKGSLHVGPCLAFYVTQEGPTTRPFGEQSRMLEDLVRLGETYGVDVFIITPGFSKELSGWRFDTTYGLWRQEDVPMPDVVIRRSGRFREPGSAVAADLGMLARQGRLHSLPRASSNKWTFYQSVRDNPAIRNYLPSTRRVRNAGDIAAAVRQYGDIYLKPIAGAQGISIKRLRTRRGGGFYVTEEKRIVSRMQERLSEDFRPQTEVVESVLDSAAGLEKMWNQLSNTAFKQWIVQESIDLIKTANGCPVDFRWLVQDSDCPVVTSRVARRGSPGSITTNLHTGGAADDALEVLDELQVKNSERKIGEIDELAKQVITHLRKKFGPFAEVGVDIGLTSSGNVYVFEVNPTPGRRMLRSLQGNERELSLVRLIEYAIRASGFEDGKPR